MSEIIDYTMSNNKIYHLTQEELDAYSLWIVRKTQYWLGVDIDKEAWLKANLCPLPSPIEGKTTGQ